MNSATEHSTSKAKRAAGFGRAACAGSIGIALPAIITILLALALSSCSARHGASQLAASSGVQTRSTQATAPSAGSTTKPAGQTLRSGRASGSSQTPQGAGGQASGGPLEYGAGAASSAAQAAGQANGGSGRRTPAYVRFVKGLVRSEQPAGQSSSPGLPVGNRQSAPGVESLMSGRSVRIADPVAAGETLTTEKGSAVEVLVGDEFDVGLGENTSVEFGGDGMRAGSESVGGLTRLELTLHRGTVIVKAGRQLVIDSGPHPAGATAGVQPPLLVEVHSPHLFLSSRGGSLLLGDNGDSTLCAVGVGRAWVLPESVVYSDLIGTVTNPSAVAMLNEILSKAVALAAGQELTVPTSQLGEVDKLGKVVRAILAANEREQRYPQATNDAFTALTSQAAAAVAKAIGVPGPISGALERELNPASAQREKMKVTSATESGPGSKRTSKVAQSAASSKTSTEAARPARKPETKPLSPATSSSVSGQSAGSTRSGAASSSPSSPQASPPLTAKAGTNAPSGTASEGSSAPSVDMQSSSPAPVGGSAAGSTTRAAGSSGSFPGPVPPTPPTPPKAP